MKFSKIASLLIIAGTLSACGDNKAVTTPTSVNLLPEYQDRLDIYKTVTLSADLSHLSANQKKMLSLLIEASDIIDDLFWQQAFGEDKTSFLASISDDKVREFARINYGPWDRLNGDKAFLTHTATKNHGAQFYPSDMSKETKMVN